MFRTKYFVILLFESKNTSGKKLNTKDKIELKYEGLSLNIFIFSKAFEKS